MNDSSKPVILIIGGLVLVMALVIGLALHMQRRIQNLPATKPAQPTQPMVTWTAPAGEPAWVGRSACTECHQNEHDRWHGSHHDLAMDPATDETVLADFNDTSFTALDGTTSTFYRKGEQFWVRTDGPDGELTDFQVTYTFGVEPLQQYLIPFEDGRYQCLNVVWDTRSTTAGGQRWVHLYDEPIPAHDPLHWTKPLQTWNFMCAECHSTNLQKNYDAKANTYATTWSEIDVSCEACHGPAGHHIAWTKAGEPAGVPGAGFAHSLRHARLTDWRIDPVTGSATTMSARRNDIEVESCGRCHARRAVTADHVYGASLAHHYNLDEVAPPTYHVDGQILDEDYVYGSFVQSKMYHAGVTCTDCHDPHSLNRRFDDNRLCIRCHDAEKFDSPSHHHHIQGGGVGSGSMCIDCHMPGKIYMAVDFRRDHRFGSPRPDLNLKHGVPDACSTCHDGETERMAEVFFDWYGKKQRDDAFVDAMGARLQGRAEALGALRDYALDGSRPDVLRAGALSQWLVMDPQPNVRFLDKVARQAGPHTRQALADYLSGDGNDWVVTIASVLLEDEIPGVRASAARALAGRVPPGLSTVYARARADLYRQHEINADRAETLADQGMVNLREGDAQEALGLLKRATQLDPTRSVGWANLADLYRSLGDEAQCQATLRAGLAHLPQSAELHHALGLALIRGGETEAALKSFEAATALRQDVPVYTLLRVLALDRLGRRAEAMPLLQEAAQRHPTDPDLANLLRAWSAPQ